jgi:hypothetical protein
MAGEIRLILAEKKEIRGVKHLPGEVLFVGECAKGLTPADIDKAIQLKQIRVDLKAIQAEEKKSAKAQDSKPSQSQK